MGRLVRFGSSLSPVNRAPGFGRRGSLQPTVVHLCGSPRKATTCARCSDPASLAWRSDDALQLGVDDPNPVVLNGLPLQCRTALELMDGTSTCDAILARLATTGSTDGISELVDRLMAVGALVDGGRWPGGASVAVAARDQLLPDLMARAPRDPDLWWESLARTHATVVGASRLGAIIACALRQLASVASPSTTHVP